MKKQEKELKKYSDDQLIKELEQRKKARENNLTMIIHPDIKETMETIKITKCVKKIRIGNKEFMGNHKVMVYGYAAREFFRQVFKGMKGK